MEILQIAKGRLKVTLNAEELSEYQIDPDGMDSDEEGTAKGFEELLAVVSAKTEQQFSGGKTYVQIYPARDGGCELFFIHIDTVAKPEKALVPLNDPSGYLCIFEQRQEAARFMALLKARKLNGTVYLQPQTDRYLVFVSLRGEEHLLLEEFGRRVDPKTALYLKEHCASVSF